MPTPTYIPLATVTLGSSAASVTFSSIPATYRDLILVFNGTMTATDSQFLRFNGDTTDANYTGVFMRGNGSATSSSSTGKYISTTSGGRLNVMVQIMDYSATDKHKTFLQRGDTAEAQVVARAMRWANTAAITSVSVVSDASTFASGMTMSLYGVVA